MDEQQRHTFAALSQFSVCQLADALGDSCAVETSIAPVDSHYRICGAAFTAECTPGDNLTVHHALHLAQPGDVLVVGGSPDCEGALWGELMSISAKSRGLAGTIIDGPVRDRMEIEALGYPVFGRRFHPRRVSKETYGRLNVPVPIGALSISPGDLIVADANGVINISPARAQETIQLAGEVARKETRIKAEILSGRSMFDILNLQPHLTGKNGVTFPPTE